MGLALCTSQAASNVAKLKNYLQIITDIFYYFSKSAKRSKGLKKVQEVLESDVLRIKEVHSVRWFSFYNALYAIYHIWGALVTYFASHAESDAKAKGFLKKITEYEFIGIFHFLMDIIPITTQLNLVFQKQDLDLAAVSPVVDATVQHIKVACEQGKHQQDLKEKLKQDGSEFTLEEHMVKVSASQISTVQKVKADFVEALESSLQKRFPKESMDVVSAFEVLALKSLSFVPREEIDDYGNDKVEILIEHYGINHKTENGVIAAVIDGPACRREWSIAKRLVLQQKYPRDKMSLLWKIMYQNHKDVLPNLITLAELALILPIHTVDCERGFSKQNLIKSKSRNRIEDATLNRLMMISIEGRPLEEFDFAQSLSIWKAEKDRRISRKP